MNKDQARPRLLVVAQDAPSDQLARRFVDLDSVTRRGDYQPLALPGADGLVFVGKGNEEGRHRAHFELHGPAGFIFPAWFGAYAERPLKGA